MQLGNTESSRTNRRKLQSKYGIDGYMEYIITLKANEKTELDDIRLEIPMNTQVAKYWLGMGQVGSEIPDSYQWKWDVQKNQEGFWIGNVNAGLHCVFRDENYVRPLNTNFYHSKPLIIPECWNNSGKGGINLPKRERRCPFRPIAGHVTCKKGNN